MTVTDRELRELMDERDEAIARVMELQTRRNELQAANSDYVERMRLLAAELRKTQTELNEVAGDRWIASMRANRAEMQARLWHRRTYGWMAVAFFSMLAVVITYAVLR